MYVHVSRHSEAFVLSVDDCLYFLLREFDFLCYQPLCPFSVILAMLPVFCVISHCVRIRVPCFCHRIRVLCFNLLVRVRVLCYQPSCSCPFSMFCVRITSRLLRVLCFGHHVRVRVLCYQPSCPCSMLPDIVSQTVSTSL